LGDVVVKRFIVKCSSALKRVAAVAALALPVAAPSAVLAETKPVVVVSLAGYDALIGDLNFMGELSGTPQLAQSLEGILALVTRAQGLVGLDKTKPIGASVSISEDGQPVPLVFVPVTDSEKLLDALQGLVPEVEDLGDDILRLKPINSPSVFMKEAEGWAFLSNSQDNLDDVPANPGRILGDLAKKYDLAVEINVGNVPQPYIDMAVGQMKQGAQGGLKQLPDEDDETYRVRKEFVERYLGQVSDVLEELDRITFGFAIDSKTRNSYLDVSVTVEPGGKMAGQFAAAAKSGKTTKFAGLADKDAVANLHFTSPVMEEDKEVLLEVLEMGRKEAAKQIDEDESIDGASTKQAVREMATDFFDVVEATVKGGTLNGGAVMLGDGPFELVLGGLVVDARKLEKAVKRAVDMFGQAPEFPPVKLNAAEHDGVTFHTLTVPAPDDEFSKILGDEITVALGFGDDRIVIAAGENPVKAASGVLDKSKGGAGAKLPPVQLQLKLAPLVKLGAEADSDETNKAMAELIAKLLEESEKDHINVTSQIVPNGSTMRIEIEEGVLEAFGKAAKQGMARGR
jgi:hypothetical protein